MIEIGFPELLLVSIMTLLVVGPQRLPEAVRNLMLWLGRLRRSFAHIKHELEQEIGADEIRQQLHNEAIMKDLRKSQEQIQQAINTTDSSIAEVKNSLQTPINLHSHNADTGSAKDQVTGHSTDNSTG